MSEFKLSRRGFLKAAIAGAAIAASASPVFALIKDQFIEDVKTLIQLHDELIDMTIKKEVIPTQRFSLPYVASVMRDDITKAEYDAKFDEIFAHIINKFDVPVEGSEGWEQALADTNAVFDNTDDRSFRDIPPTLCPAAIGISAARSLLSINRLRMNPQSMNNFVLFAEKYQFLIIR
jgi:hypothetical protein